MKTFVAKFVLGVIVYEIIDYEFHWAIRKINTKIDKDKRNKRIQERSVPGFKPAVNANDERLVIKGFEGKEVSC